MLRANLALRQYKKAAFVSDLKSSDQCAMKERLLMCSTRDGWGPFRAIALILTENLVQTIDDDTEIEQGINRGVTQGSLFSPSHFNLYIYSRMEEAREEVRLVNDAFTFFAYNVVCFSKDARQLQCFLDFASGRTIENGLTWFITKCVALCADDDVTHELNIYWKHMSVESDAEYLGFALAYGKIAPKHIL